MKGNNYNLKTEKKPEKKIFHNEEFFNNKRPETLLISGDSLKVK